MRRRLRAMAMLLPLTLPLGPAWAQQAQPDSGSEPIDIVANSLKVEQGQQIATFSGNVQAVQGEMTLTAQLLRVFYNRTEGGSTSAAGVAGDGNAIRRIEAEGDVHLSNPTDTARGDSGVYDVAGQKITLDGNVVLTSSDNVVKGAALDMDLRTNVSTVRGQQGGTAPQRVRARFVPGKKGT